MLTGCYACVTEFLHIVRHIMDPHSNTQRFSTLHCVKQPEIRCITTDHITPSLRNTSDASSSDMKTNCWSKQGPNSQM